MTTEKAASPDRWVWGVDLGGTKIEGAILDVSAPDRALWRMRMPSESERGYEHIIGRVRLLVERLEQAAGVRHPAVIGFGTPGAVEPSTGLMKNCNTVALNRRPLRADLSASLGIEARLANDANCFALAESSLGAARGHRVVLGLIIGTGVGGGLVVHDRVLDGAHGIAGEWGHNPICGETTLCYCGRRGCVETAISGPALERFYAERTGSRLTLEEIAVRGDDAARETLERLRAKFGEALAAVINILDPDAIVIGGGVGNLDLLYEPETRRAIEQHLFNPELRTLIVRPTLGDSAGVFGAALLARS
jgi:fructokinase